MNGKSLNIELLNTTGTTIQYLIMIVGETNIDGHGAILFDNNGTVYEKDGSFKFACAGTVAANLKEGDKLGVVIIHTKEEGHLPVPLYIVKNPGQDENQEIVLGHRSVLRPVFDHYFLKKKSDKPESAKNVKAGIY